MIKFDSSENELEEEQIDGITEPYEVEVSTEDIDIKDYPKEVVVVPIMSSPIFPGMIAPIIISEEKFTKEFEKQIQETGYIALNLVKYREKKSTQDIEDQSKVEKIAHAEEDNISSKDIYRVGILCKVAKKIRLPEEQVNILVHGVRRYRILEFVEEKPLMKAKIQVFEDIIEHDEELDAYTRTVINQVKKLSEINPYFNEEMRLAMLNSPSTGSLADLVAFSLSLDIPEAQDFIETLVVKKRFAKLLVYLKREKEVADIQKKISDEVNLKVNKYQREYYLKEQLKVIRNELGLDADDKSRDINKLKKQIEKAKMHDEARKSVEEELDRLASTPESSPEYNIIRSYINWMAELPWSKSSKDKLNITDAKKLLNSDHYGLEKAKERVLEFLAVRKLKPNYDGTILCFAGPPGVGKTSLGNSIAKALGRKFYRFSLGGMRDEAEIKGHRKTYIGAMPGRIIQTLKRVEVNNPVIMLDEIDKLCVSYQGDPAAALLEVLDPEQNKTFIDHYLDVPFDLSNVLFIATANYIAEIPEPLLDRMEVIELSGYTLEEKLLIAQKWVIPKQLEKHGLLKKDIDFNVSTLKKIISGYAREPGIRVMEQCIAKICRQAVLKKVTTKSTFKKFKPTAKDLEKILGMERFETELPDKKQVPGVVTGLAWTAYGGEILSVESIPLEGKGEFKLTGQLGDVMNESASLAYSYVKRLLQSESKKLNQSKKNYKTKKTLEQSKEEEKKSDYLAEHEIHLHLPAGATPKDGPSAGITMATALYGLAKNKSVKNSLAMTGELSLTGKVLPVGGIKEKVLAAKRAGIKNIILPKQNDKDLKEVSERHRKGLKFHLVENFSEVLKIVF